MSGHLKVGGLRHRQLDLIMRLDGQLATTICRLGLARLTAPRSKAHEFWPTRIVARWNCLRLREKASCIEVDVDNPEQQQQRPMGKNQEHSLQGDPLQPLEQPSVVEAIVVSSIEFPVVAHDDDDDAVVANKPFEPLKSLPFVDGARKVQT